MNKKEESQMAEKPKFKKDAQVLYKGHKAVVVGIETKTRQGVPYREPLYAIEWGDGHWELVAAHELQKIE